MWLEKKNTFSDAALLLLIKLYKQYIVFLGKNIDIFGVEARYSQSLSEAGHFLRPGEAFPSRGAHGTFILFLIVIM